MTAREKAEQLRQEAIQELLAERQQIDDMLATLGHDREARAPTAKRRRGRPPKAEGFPQQQPGDGGPTAAAPV